MRKTSCWLACCFCFGLFSGPALASNFSKHLSKLIQVVQVLVTQSLQQPDLDSLMQGAARGMVAALDDPYSSYLSADNYVALSKEQSGEVVGIGVELAYREQRLEVMSVLEDTPAERAGLQSGAEILSIEGQAVERLSWPEINQLLQGEAGQPIGLSFRLSPGSAPQQKQVPRELLKLQALSFSLLSDGICQLKIQTFFNERLHEQVAETLLANADSCESGLILDLRNNPGGLVAEAVQVAGQLGTQGTVVQVVSNTGKLDLIETTDLPIYPQTPIVVLVNSGTASAAEILAAALQESGRAIVLGENTFGKARVQSLLGLADGTGISLTTNSYLTRLGKNIHGVGIAPDFYFSPETPAEQWTELALDYLLPL